MRNKISTIFAAVLLSVISASAINREALKTTDAFKKWDSDKYSMMIHFGLYSHLGGEWKGVPVTNAGGEMIQSAAGIYYDIYEELADEFDPQGFDADAIVQTAKKAGMRSIIFTAKHHDGFCMFDTETTEFNSVDATESGRDYVREMAEACKKEGLKFGLYFSLLDWHSPFGGQMSSHNADKISDALHNQNMAQIYELILNYGDISEFWFDMGSLTPEQSEGIYDLVKKFQPTCMISDRLGNDAFDFAVTAENICHHIDDPWQSLAPMFNGTWGWRSWEEKGKASDKAADKLKALTYTVVHGGNYILNIGLDSNGEIESFEKEVLNQIGGWLQKNGQAIYGTAPSPFENDFTWGGVTVKDKTAYLILNGEYPSNGEIVIPTLEGNKMEKCKDVTIKNTKAGTTIKVKQEWFSDKSNIKVLEATYKYKVQSPNRMQTQRKGIVLDRSNALIEHSHSGFDYYTNYRSETGYSWAINRSQIKNLHIFYSKESLGKTVILTTEGKDISIKLDRTVSAELNYLDVDARTDSKITEMSFCKVPDKMFETDLMDIFNENRGLMKSCTTEDLRGIKVRPMQSVIVKGVINASKDGYKVIEVEAGNGVEVVLNGQTVMKHMNPYGTKSRMETVLLKLKKGRNEVILRSFNRFESKMDCYLGLDPKQFLYRKTVSLGKGKGSKIIKLWHGLEGTPHHDAEMHNFIVFTKSE